MRGCLQMERWVRPGVSGEVESVVGVRVSRLRTGEAGKGRRGQERIPLEYYKRNAGTWRQIMCLKRVDDYKHLNIV